MIETLMNGKTIVSRMQEKKKITQMDYNRVIIAALEKIDKPTMSDVREHHNSIFGGICFYCGKSWEKVVNKTAFLDFVHYEPRCDCIDNQKKNRNDNPGLEMIRNCNIPERYIDVTINGMDLNIKKEIVEAIKKVREYVLKRMYNHTGLLLFGDVGTGKTHLAVSVLKAIVLRERKTGWFLNTSNFIDEVFYSKTNMIKEIAYHQVVVLDDIDKVFTGKDKDERTWRKEQFFSLIDSLVNMKRIVIITSNVTSIKELSKYYADAIVSRIIRTCGKCIVLRGHDYQLKKKGII